MCALISLEGVPRVGVSSESKLRGAEGGRLVSYIRDLSFAERARTSCERLRCACRRQSAGPRMPQ